MNGAITTVNPGITYSENNLSNELFQLWYEYAEVEGNTLKTYTKCLQQFAKYLASHQISAPRYQDIKAYKEYLVINDNAPATVNLYLTSIKNFFKFTEDNGLYPDIASKVKGIKGVGKDNFKRDSLSQEEVIELLQSIDQESLQGKRDFSMILLMVVCGLRTIEVSRASIEDLTRRFSSEVLLIQGKGHREKDQIVKLPVKVNKAIQDYLTARSEREGTLEGKAPLFVSCSNRKAEGSRLTTDSISRTVRNQLRKIGINRPHEVTAHSLRHTTATELIHIGQSLENVQGLLRHKNSDTTRIYTHNEERRNNNSEELLEERFLNW